MKVLTASVFPPDGKAALAVSLHNPAVVRQMSKACHHMCSLYDVRVHEP